MKQREDTDSDIEARFVGGGVGTVIWYKGKDRVRLRDLRLDVEMTAADARRLAAMLIVAANESSPT